ncbi:trypsin alpha-3 [Drosophila yakuba]|uniref:Peptidase S1 domain-containing protein n=1 Tax=Drosophila yakuba TaxID=7245 RepID=B4P912_DROYA|nr:trypsin alpha-3 [Drosophila yakuba]EDW92252.1 uncharacterized protein Dyak_GE11618 [Drosophila yakuba]
MLLRALPLLLTLCVLVLSNDDTDADEEEEEDDDCNKATLGGHPVDITTAPWSASVSIREKAKCGGVIYSLSHIVTAGKCVDGFLNKAIRIRVGSTTRSDGVIEADVCNITVHEKFTGRTILHNLAILKLCGPLTASKTIQTIQLAKQFPANGAMVTANGWASFRWWTTYWSKCLDDEAHKLLKAEVKMLGPRQCTNLGVEHNWSKQNFTEYLFCTEKFGKDACSFGMGSPVVHQGKLIGIMSKGGCSDLPEVYINIIRYKSWLESHTK